ncbi:MAG: polysaccharide biosynthesis protein [Lachnospiraceae bacterium]|nr:polysaccharide biosynthesis protein [Lachnospiraceae bacterium]
MNNLQKAKINIVVRFLYQVIAIAMGLFIPRLAMIGYGSDVNGLLSSALQFVAYLTIFEAGIQAVAMKSLYKTVGNNDCEGTNAILAAVNKNYKKTGFYYLIGLLILSLIYPLFIKQSGVNYITAFFVVFFSGLSNVVLFFWQGKYRILLQVEGKQYFISFLDIIANITNHVVKIVLLYLNVNVAIVIFGSFLVSLIPACAIMRHIKRKYHWLDLNVKPNFSVLAQSKDAIVHQVSWLIFTSTDTLILTLFCDLKVVSVYSIYNMINSYMLTFSKIPFESISFRLGQLYNNDKGRFKKYINCVELFTASICFILFTVTLCLMTSFVGLYTSGVNDINYVDSKLAILFVIMQLLTYMRTPMLNVISYAGHFKQTLLPTIIETVINITVSIVGVIFLGIYGVLLGTIAALIYRTADVILYSNRKLLNRSSKRTFSYYIVGFILIFGIYILFNNLDIVIDNFFKFAVAGTVLTVVVTLIFILTIAALFREEFGLLKVKALKWGVQGQ